MAEIKGASVYRIKVQGIVDPDWSAWLGSMTIYPDRQKDGSPITVIVGQVVDQAALRGILDNLWDLNLNVLSVTRIEGDTESQWQGKWKKRT